MRRVRLAIALAITVLGGVRCSETPSGPATSGVIGISVDASGPNVNGVFGAMLDGEGPFLVGPGGPHYMTGVSAGDHVVSLVGPAHCAVETSPQSVTVGGPTRDTVEVTFSVTCGLAVGAVHITAPTTGLEPASIRYRVMYQHYGYWDYGGALTELGTLEPNGTLIAEVPASRESGADPYWYLFHLTDVPANCVAQDPNPVLEGGLTITSGDTLDIEYPVVCTPGTQPPAPPPSVSGLLALTSSGDIHVRDVSGSTFQRLTSDGGLDFLDSYDAHATWSPDGTRIAYTRYARDFIAEIWVIDADGTNARRLSPAGTQDYKPTWSPDGRRIAFVNVPDMVSNGDIYVMNADGTDRARLTALRQGAESPAWSPDGDRIAFTTYGEAGNADIYVMSPDGTDPVNLTNDVGFDTEPAWSPDGTRVVFARQGDLFVVSADGTGLSRLTHGLLGADQPSWSPDGSTVAFARYVDCDDSWNCPGPFLWTVQVSDGQLWQLPVMGVDGIYPSWRP